MSIKRERRGCGRRKRSLPLAEFARYGNGYQSYCRACQREYDAAWYQQNKGRRQAKVKYPPHVMEWDHLPEAIKTLVVADTRRAAHSKKRILAE